MCLDWELNQQLFGSQACTQSTELHYTSQGRNSFLFLFFKDFIYLSLEREGGRAKERERNIDVYARDTLIRCLLHTPNWGSGPQPRHMPWLWIKQVTLQSQACAQSTEPHQPGQSVDFFTGKINNSEVKQWKYNFLWYVTCINSYTCLPIGQGSWEKKRDEQLSLQAQGKIQLKRLLRKRMRLNYYSNIIRMESN